MTTILASLLASAFLMTGIAMATASTKPTPRPEGPSLAATDAWLQSNLPRFTYSVTEVALFQDRASYTVHDCSLTIRIDETDDYYHSPYPDITPEPKDLRLWRLEFFPATAKTFHSTSHGNHNVVSVAVIPFRDISLSYPRLTNDAFSTHLPGITVWPRMLSFSFLYKSTAERARRAMQHAIVLCGGKADAF